MSDVLLEVRDLTRVFDVSLPWLNRVIEREERQFLRAVDNVSFSICRGETFALVGESGSGKSTIGKMIVGLLGASAGNIVFDGTPLDTASAKTMRELRSRFQMIFQSPFASLNPRWKVRDIISEPIEAFALVDNAKDRMRRVDELLEHVGLSSADGGKYPHEFSGGQRQRIAIARALSSNPDFIVCDEPTSALDVSVQAQILNLMRDLQDELKLTYLFISHDLSVVRHMATRIGVLYLGALVEDADAKKLFDQPQHPYTRMLLDAVPDIEMRGHAREPVQGEIPNPLNPPKGCPFNPRCPIAFEPCTREPPPEVPTPIGTAKCFALQPDA